MATFPQRLRIVNHVGHHHQYVHVQIKGQVLGGGERRAGQNQALDGRVIGQVHKHHHLPQHAAGLEIFLEKPGIGMGHAHGGEHYRECAFLSGQFGLAHDLRGEAVVGQPRPRKNRKFLAPHQRVHAIDGGNPGLDELPRISPGRGIHRVAIHRALQCREQGRAAIRDGLRR